MVQELYHYGTIWGRAFRIGFPVVWVTKVGVWAHVDSKLDQLGTKGGHVSSMVIPSGFHVNSMGIPCEFHVGPKLLHLKTFATQNFCNPKLLQLKTFATQNFCNSKLREHKLCKLNDKSKIPKPKQWPNQKTDKLSPIKILSTRTPPNKLPT